MKVMNNVKKDNFITLDLVMTAMLAALCTIATYIKVPAGNGAMVHLGSAAIFTAAILFGGVKGGLAGGIGSAIFDIIGGFGPYTLWSFIIKGISGFLVGTIANSKVTKSIMGKLTEGKSTRVITTLEIIKNIIATLVGATWTLLGYLVAWSVVLGGWEAALGNAPFSLLTSAAGIIVAIPLAIALKKPLAKYTVK